MTLDLYTAAYGHRYSDPCGSFVGFTEKDVEKVTLDTMENERLELPGYCEHERPDSTATACTESGYCEDCLGNECSMCDADLVWWGVHRVGSAAELGGLRATINLVKECRENPDGVTSIEQ